MLTGAGGGEGEGEGGGGAGARGGAGRALLLPLVPRADAAACPTARTPALTRTPLSGGLAQVRPLSQFLSSTPPRGRSILALSCSHFIFRCFACGEGDRPSSGVTGLLVV